MIARLELLENLEYQPQWIFTVREIWVTDQLISQICQWCRDQSTPCFFHSDLGFLMYPSSEVFATQFLLTWQAELVPKKNFLTTLQQIMYTEIVKQAILLQGLPASGKSTWCQAWISQHPSWQRINNDEIRSRIQAQTGQPWSPKQEHLVGQERERQIQEASVQSTNIVVDNTHMNPRTLRRTQRFCESLGYVVTIQSFLDVPLQECVRRDAQRTGTARVGESVIRKMWQHWVSANPSPLPTYQASNLPDAVIVDVDGTLADHQGIRDPYDDTRVHLDRPRVHVIRTVQALNRHDYCRVIVMSGRSDRCRAATADWLTTHAGWILPYYDLLMRAHGDRRPDSEVKRELYHAHVDGKYNVLAVFDDRASVIRDAWTPLGLPVFRCGVIDQDEF